MKVSIADQDYSAESAYVLAQTEIDIDFNWISNVSFPTRLYETDVEHDNRTLETDHYLIFSDGSSDHAKVRFAKIAEETLHEVLEAFHLQMRRLRSGLNCKRASRTI